MRSHFPLSLLMVATLTFTSGTFAHPANPPAGDVQTITVTAQKYEFDPSPIRVKQGTRVQLKITASDHAHGFSIKESPEEAKDGKAGLIFSSAPGCLKIEEGQTATVEFVAQAPGTYSFRCCVHCGWHHRSMKGDLIVEP
jgi:cytochrome c oxidase subunit II